MTATPKNRKTDLNLGLGLGLVLGLGLGLGLEVEPRVRVRPGVAAAAVQGLQLLQLQIQGPYIAEDPISYYEYRVSSDVVARCCWTGLLTPRRRLSTAIQR